MPDELLDELLLLLFLLLLKYPKEACRFKDFLNAFFISDSLISVVVLKNKKAKNINTDNYIEYVKCVG